MSNRIAGIINRKLRPGQLYLEPFCGACWVTMNISARRRVVADANLDLILMWQAIQKGWKPPMGLSEEKYKTLKNSGPSPLRGFAGFQCSFAGAWFQSYARGGNRNYAYGGRRGILSAVFRLYGVVFCCADYRSWNPKNAVIYCDPPYRNAAGYTATGNFNSDMFWEQVRRWSEKNTVYVSETEAPGDFKMVMDETIRGGLRDSAKRNVTRREKLFVLES